MATRNTEASLIFAPFILFVFSCLKVASANRTTLYMDEVRGLSELPMNELIHIKSSLVDAEDFSEDNDQASSRMLPYSLPVALPLKMSNKRNNARPMRRYGEHEEEKGVNSKISKIFQLAVTALSFLAFGGYLLTLIIMSIKRNTPQPNNGLIVLSNVQGLQNYLRPKRNIFDPAENDFEIERLYQGMIMLSKSYATYEANK